MAKTLSHGTKMKGIGSSEAGAEGGTWRIVKPPLCTANDKTALQRELTAALLPQH